MKSVEGFYAFMEEAKDRANPFGDAVIYALAIIINQLDELLRLARQVDVEDHQ